MQSFLLFALLSLFAASQADVFIITTYNSSDCTFASKSQSYPTGCLGVGPLSNQNSIDGNTAFVKSFLGSGSCGGNAATTLNYTLGAVCTALINGGNTYYKAYTGRTVTPAPGPNDQITENYSGSGCGGTGNAVITYNSGCTAKDCGAATVGSTRGVCLTQGQAYATPNSSGFAVTFSLAILAVAAVIVLF
ncbi:hypothetical protein PROFUN_17076 [Planoprotostelium fungivorum]|uniref:Uncharacterized protein n=1 Tax=Planoprotostelium fungivorum TaxID=1890364 RepID=A0A2P6MMQ3_9EUKA|nr:hypothetical protein PROFUN_17076 [Planoprotostelium fungivorum]